MIIRTVVFWQWPLLVKLFKCIYYGVSWCSFQEHRKHPARKYTFYYLGKSTTINKLKTSFSVAKSPCSQEQCACLTTIALQRCIRRNKYKTTVIKMVVYKKSSPKIYSDEGPSCLALRNRDGAFSQTPIYLRLTWDNLPYSQRYEVW